MAILLLVILLTALVVVVSSFVAAAHDLNLSEVVVALFVTVAVVLPLFLVVEGGTKQQDGSYLASGSKRDLVRMFPEHLPVFLETMGVVKGNMDSATKRCLWRGLTGRNHSLLNSVLETELQYAEAEEVIGLCLMAD